MATAAERTDVEIEDRVVIARDRQSVFEVFWDPTHWERLAPHVERVEMLENSETRQTFRMTLRSDGEKHQTLSTRRAFRPERIEYEQLEPPRLLRRHHGVWEFVEVAEGTEVRLRHMAEIAVEPCREHWPDLTDDEIRAEVARLLRRNGRRTIDALAEWLT